MCVNIYVFILFRLNWHWMEFRFVSNQSKKCKYKNIYVYVHERFFKVWYNTASSLIVDMFRPSETHQYNPKFPKIPFKLNEFELNIIRVIYSRMQKTFIKSLMNGFWWIFNVLFYEKSWINGAKTIAWRLFIRRLRATYAKKKLFLEKKNCYFYTRLIYVPSCHVQSFAQSMQLHQAHDLYNLI